MRKTFALALICVLMLSTTLQSFAQEATNMKKVTYYENYLIDKNPSFEKGATHHVDSKVIDISYYDPKTPKCLVKIYRTDVDMVSTGSRQVYLFDYTLEFSATSLEYTGPGGMAYDLNESISHNLIDQDKLLKDGFAYLNKLKIEYKNVLSFNDGDLSEAFYLLKPEENEFVKTKFNVFVPSHSKRVVRAGKGLEAFPEGSMIREIVKKLFDYILTTGNGVDSKSVYIYKGTYKTGPWLEFLDRADVDVIEKKVIEENVPDYTKLKLSAYKPEQWFVIPETITFNSLAQIEKFSKEYHYSNSYYLMEEKDSLGKEYKIAIRMWNGSDVNQYPENFEIEGKLYKNVLEIDLYDPKRKSYYDYSFENNPDPHFLKTYYYFDLSSLNMRNHIDFPIFKNGESLKQLLTKKRPDFAYNTSWDAFKYNIPKILKMKVDNYSELYTIENIDSNSYVNNFKRLEKLSDSDLEALGVKRLYKMVPVNSAPQISAEPSNKNYVLKVNGKATTSNLKPIEKNNVMYVPLIDTSKLAKVYKVATFSNYSIGSYTVQVNKNDRFIRYFYDDSDLSDIVEYHYTFKTNKSIPTDQLMYPLIKANNTLYISVKDFNNVIKNVLTVDTKSKIINMKIK